MPASPTLFSTETLGVLYQENYQKLLWYAQAILAREGHQGDAGRAEEVVNEAFLIALTKLGELSASPKPVGWLYNTVNNVARNMVREDQRWVKRLLNVTHFQSLVSAPPGADLELEGLIPPEDLDLLKRRYLEGMTYDELAQELGTSKSTLASRVQRSKERFKKVYREAEKFFDSPWEQSGPPRHDRNRGGSKNE